MYVCCINIIVTLPDDSDLLPHETSIMKLLEGAANNLPDKPTQRVTSLIVDFAASLTKDDILITLISGNI